MGPRLNIFESTIASRLREFVRMNHPIVLCFRVGGYPQEFLQGVHKLVSAMGVYSKEESKLAFYNGRRLLKYGSPNRDTIC